MLGMVVGTLNDACSKRENKLGNSQKRRVNDSLSVSAPN
jgi:hypothetical protein